jgi:acetylornithine deacetylase
MYAERCLLRIERRTVPGETVDQAVAEIQAIVDRIKADDPSFHATVKTVFYREPFETSADSDLVRLLENAVEQTLGRRTGHIGSSGWMDSALLSAAGAETIIIGPTGDGLHTREEWVDIPSVISLAEILTATAMRYCA